MESMVAPEEEKRAEPGAEFDAYHQNYTDVVNQALSFTPLSVDYFTAVKAAYIADFVKVNFAGAASLATLDIGCGVGNCHPLLRQKVGGLQGIDVSAASIDVARQRNPEVSYRTYAGGILPYEDESFDLAFTICVMHHVKLGSRQLFLEEMQRVIKPGGWILIFEHNPLNPLTMRVVNNCEFDKDAILLRSSELVSLCREAGLSAVRHSFILNVPAKGHFSRGLDRALSWFPLGAQYFVQAEKLHVNQT